MMFPAAGSCRAADTGKHNIACRMRAEAYVGTYTRANALDYRLLYLCHLMSFRYEKRCIVANADLRRMCEINC